MVLPFDSSYSDFDKHRFIDAREYFISLARIIVKEPLATHIVRTTAPSGKTRFFVVDRSAVLEEGDIAVVCTDHGLRAGRIKRLASMNHVWGKIVWVIQEG
jgi:hypothetical protein